MRVFGLLPVSSPPLEVTGAMEKRENLDGLADHLIEETVAEYKHLSNGWIIQFGDNATASSKGREAVSRVES